MCIHGLQPSDACWCHTRSGTFGLINAQAVEWHKDPKTGEDTLKSFIPHRELPLHTVVRPRGHGSGVSRRMARAERKGTLGN